MVSLEYDYWRSKRDLGGGLEVGISSGTSHSLHQDCSMATVPPPLRDDNGSGLIRCTKCGFEVPHACVAGRGGTRIDVEEWLSVCQQLEAANGKPHQCPRLLEEPNWPTRPIDLGPGNCASQSTSIPDENVLVALEASKLRMLDEWIATLPEPKPSRAEGIQRLVELGVRYRLEKLITF